MKIVIFNSYVSLPEGKPPYAVDFPTFDDPRLDPIPAVASPWQRSWQSTGSPDSASVLKCTPAAPEGDRTKRPAACHFR